MEGALQLAFGLGRLALIPLVGYAVLRLAGRWPWPTLLLLVALVLAGTGALSVAAQDGFNVDPQSRQMEIGSNLARWCFGVGGVLLVLAFPALPLVVVARAQNGAATGPVGVQWMFVLFGYFMACSIFGMVLYSLTTGIIK